MTPATASALPLLMDASLALVELDDAALPVADGVPEDADFVPLDALVAIDVAALPGRNNIVS